MLLSKSINGSVGHVRERRVVVGGKRLSFDKCLDGAGIGDALPGVRGEADTWQPSRHREDDPWPHRRPE